MIKYKKRRKYKYNLHSDFTYQSGITIAAPVALGYLEMQPDGGLLVKAGYSWDGPSGPTIDTENFMQGSLVHDALYQLMREGFVDQSQREAADRLLRKMCKDDGMSGIRAWWVYQGVRIGGASSARPDMLEAP